MRSGISDNAQTAFRTMTINWPDGRMLVCGSPLGDLAWRRPMERARDVGSHSLLAMQIVAQIRSMYQIDFTLREMFEAPTIARLSDVIHGRIVAAIEKAHG
jgi:nucleotidyltransferase/DNA polymerase involved in DNA repair